MFLSPQENEGKHPLRTLIVYAHARSAPRRVPLWAEVVVDGVLSAYRGLPSVPHDG